MVVVERFCVFF